MKVCADVTCNTPIPEGKTRCPKCSKKKMVDAPGDAPAPAPDAAPAAASYADEPKTEELKPAEVAAPKDEKTEPKEVPVKPVKATESRPSSVIVVVDDDEKPSAEDAEGDHCARCARLRAALRDARSRIRKLAQENRTLREELLSAGEMIENLATDIEKSTLETEA